jgi:putative intracellular protease/amidase
MSVAEPGSRAMDGKPWRPTGKRIASPAIDGVKETDLTGPREAMQRTGSTAELLWRMAGEAKPTPLPGHGPETAGTAGTAAVPAPPALSPA